MNIAEIEQRIIDIFTMTVTCDKNIDQSEIDMIEKILKEMEYNFDESHNEYFEISVRQSAADIIKKYEQAIEELNALDKVSKKYILKYVMKIVDADKIMHDNEVQLVADIIRKWSLD